jgi:hypothetical protein
MKRNGSRPVVFPLVCVALFAVAALAATSAVATGSAVPGVTAAVQPAPPAWDPAILSGFATPAVGSSENPAFSPRVAPPCPVACNPATCLPPKSCKQVINGCPPLCR